jgi:hypothetical protein
VITRRHILTAGGMDSLRRTERAFAQHHLLRPIVPTAPPDEGTRRVRSALDVEPQQVVLGEAESADGWFGFLNCWGSDASYIDAAKPTRDAFSAGG